MFDMVKMMKKAMGVKSQMAKVKKELAGRTIEASSSDGMVTVTATGDGDVTHIEIDSSLVNAEKKPSLEKSIVEAVSRALKSASEMAAKEMSKLTEGLGLPPGMLP